MNRKIDVVVSKVCIGLFVALFLIGAGFEVRAGLSVLDKDDWVLSFACGWICIVAAVIAGVIAFRDDESW